MNKSKREIGAGSIKDQKLQVTIEGDKSLQLGDEAITSPVSTKPSQLQLSEVASSSSLPVTKSQEAKMSAKMTSSMRIASRKSRKKAEKLERYNKLQSDLTRVILFTGPGNTALTIIALVLAASAARYESFSELHNEERNNYNFVRDLAWYLVIIVANLFFVIYSWVPYDFPAIRKRVRSWF
eukprot:CAMPEP_0167764216 /NCGR_PEP_ID=MMETSP0110_2-20121227/13883_1 /TAXON_ID=629695 /ORGANISM="Gymnochlora sp., Strain CCMP2014" /LENGTH=181 /DNA_ID=CAMNT_0007651543 /DNA_START=560 /DNA_END=1105 /DNA_ORIENTATION=+